MQIQVMELSAEFDSFSHFFFQVALALEKKSEKISDFLSKAFYK